VAREPGFPKYLKQSAVAKLLVLDDKRSAIPAFVPPAVQRPIRQCYKRDRWRRPTLNQILDRLEAMTFKLTTNVKSSKLSDFVKKVSNWEKSNAASAAFAHSTPPQSVSQ
jgi:hypothetical protein